MIASEWNALRSPNNKVLGHNGVLNRDDEIGLPSPSAIGDMAAWYDLSATTSLFRDGSDRLQLMGDVSGNSGAGKAGDRFLNLDGQVGTYASFSTVALNGDLDIRQRLSATDWTPAASSVLYWKDNSHGLRLNTTGTLNFFWYTGAATNSKNSTVTVGSAGVTDLSGKWVRGTLDVDNGASGSTVIFYLSDDGITWTQLGDPIVTAGITSVDTGGASYVGARNSGSLNVLSANVSRTQVRNSIVGTTTSPTDDVSSYVVFDADFTSQNLGSASFTESSSNAATVTLNGTAIISYVDEGNALVSPGVTANNASVAYEAGQDITTKLDLRAVVSNNDLSASEALVIGKYGASASNSSYMLTWTGGNALKLYLTPDGSALSAATSSVTLSATAFEKIGVRCTWVGSSGDVVFYYSTDLGVTWIQLGTTQNIAYASLNIGVRPITVGSRDGSSFAFDGNIYTADVRNNILNDGTGIVCDLDFTAQAKAATSFTEASSLGATVTINQTAIALPARIHGARDLYMGTAASQPKYLGYDGTNYGYLNGVSGNYFSTPDSAAIDVNGDADFVWYGSLDDWTPAVETSVISKWAGSGQRSYLFRVTTGGTLRLLTTADGSTSISRISTSAVPFSDGEKGWIRAKLDVDNGAAGNDVLFYTSTDGVTWTQLGTTVTKAGVTSIFNSTTDLIISGNDYPTTTNNINGKAYLAQVWDGWLDDSGTIVADFNAADYPLSGGSTFASSSTGETWTINGGAKIVTRTGLYFDGTADYLKSAPFSLSQPENVYFVGEQVSWTYSGYILDGESSNVGVIFQRDTTPGLKAYAGSISSQNDGLEVGSAGIVTAVFNGVTSGFRVNRNAIASGSFGAAAMNGLTVGARGDDSNFGNIFASEVLIYDTTAHDINTQDRLVRYLARKGSIDV